MAAGWTMEAAEIIDRPVLRRGARLQVIQHGRTWEVRRGRFAGRAGLRRRHPLTQWDGTLRDRWRRPSVVRGRLKMELQGPFAYLI